MSLWRPIDVAKACLAACAVLFSLYLLYLLRTPLTWIAISIFLSIALNPLVSVLSRWMPRFWAITSVMLGFLLMLTLLVLVLIPPLVEQGNALANNSPRWINEAKTQIQHNTMLHDWEKRLHLTQHLGDTAKLVTSHAQDVFGGVLGVAGAVAQWLLGAVTILVMTAFMLSGGPRWMEWMLAQAPEGRKQAWRGMTDRMGEAVSGYLVGNIIISFICGLGSWIVLTIVGVPYSGALAVLVALLDLIPLAGALVGAVLVGIITLFIDFPTASIVWTIWAVVYQQIENHLLQPQIYKRTVNVHPLMVVIAILFGATLMGILGALIAIPVAASIQVLLHNWWGERSKKMSPEAINPETA